MPEGHYDDCDDDDDGRLLPGEEDVGSPFHLQDNEGIVRRPCVLPSYANLERSCLVQDMINYILIIKTIIIQHQTQRKVLMDFLIIVLGCASL